MLAIDDDPDVIELLRENLADAGFRVVGARTGDDGIEKARSLRPAAVFLDILMREKDGWQVLHEVKADEATAHVPVILLSILDRERGWRRRVRLTCRSRSTAMRFWTSPAGAGDAAPGAGGRR